MEIINNPWVIGVAASFFSGLSVFLITKNIFSKKENKEYLQKVETANNELLYTMRPLIAQKNLPSLSTINSTLRSTARKYKINREDMHSIHFLVDILIKEVMDNSFLSSEQKSDFCSKIEELITQTGQLEAKLKKSVEVKYERDRLPLQSVSSLLAGTVAVTVMFITIFNSSFFERNSFNTFNGRFDNFSEASFIALAGVVASLFALMMTISLRRLSTIRKEIAFLEHKLTQRTKNIIVKKDDEKNSYTKTS